MAEMQFIDNPEVYTGSRIGVVAGRYNKAIVDRLLQGCLQTLAAQGIADGAITVVRAPGAFELPLLAQRLAAGGGVDAVIALGVVIRGGTPHFDYVAGECARGLARVSLDHDLPVVFGVLTVENEAQALERAGGSEGNKGAEAALTALEMISLLRRLNP